MARRFSTIQYNTTVKLESRIIFAESGFSTIQYNTTVKPPMWVSPEMPRFSTIQYNTTVKPAVGNCPSTRRFSTIQYNTTVKPGDPNCYHMPGFSTIQYNTTVKPQLWSFTGVNVIALTLLLLWIGTKIIQIVINNENILLVQLIFTVFLNKKYWKMIVFYVL